MRFLYGVFHPNRAMLGPTLYDGADVVGLDRFYSKTYAKSELDSLSACDRALLDASAYWTYNREFQAGDSLALVAMHIMTREQPGWTFQSAWWHPRALELHLQRPGDGRLDVGHLRPRGLSALGSEGGGEGSLVRPDHSQGSHQILRQVTP